ncbi:hypothetical protein A9Q75_12395 [Colwellia psychrerythraea]|uniref:Solute-binding protein family 3/N-terminal domain-containing protein n=1 Tax=Colwellia psychrerythraea TaxID=28229 RepID=A0A1Y5E9A9_COLPS|nr:hypothetical protein A9Q75_12395 [Colwellia psychrerythraea]
MPVLIKFFLIVSCILYSFQSNAEKILAVDYLAYPPYQIQSGGLTKDFIELLAKANLGLDIEYIKVTKTQLKLLISQGVPLIIPFANSYWFDKNSELISSKRLLHEKAYVISHQKRKLETENLLPELLDGKLTFLGKKGYKYFVIDELVKENKILRYSCDNKNLCLEMLEAYRGDFSVMAKPIYEHYITSLKLDTNKLYMSKNYLYTQDRFVLMSNIPQKSAQKINAFIYSLKVNPNWQTLLVQYHVD